MNLRAVLAILCICNSHALATVYDIPVPIYRIENIPAEDGSIQQSLIVQARAGDPLRIEKSTDLVTWTPETSLESTGTVYSLGQEVAVSMRQFTPAPPLPPGSPPYAASPLTFASLLIRPASGPAGGTIVSWSSLDTREPLVVHIPGNLASAWNSVPLAAHRFGDFYYFILYQGGSSLPPAENPPLGSSDAAMLATFEANLSILNAEIVTNEAVTRNTPPPAPPLPGSKVFWRVVATETDSDRDGISDALELQMMADVNHLSHDLADLFRGDKNDDGIPDGEQSDFDKDGTPDAQDVSTNDELLNWGKSDPLLFAFFPVSGNGAPLQVNDQGKVLYENSVWIAGQSRGLNPADGQTLSGAYAVGIGDNGFILGRGDIDLPDDFGAGTSLCHLTWPAAGGDPVALRSGTGYLYPVFVPSSGNSHVMGLTGPSDMTVNKDGRFIAWPATVTPGSGSGPNGSASTLQPDAGTGPKVWLAQEASTTPTVGAVTPPFTTWLAEEGTVGGTDANGAFRASDEAFDQLYSRLTLLPNGKAALFAGYPGIIPFSFQNPDRTHPKVWDSGFWRNIDPLDGAVDFSTEGKFALIRSGYIWCNKPDGLLPLAELAPGLPAAWKDPVACRLIDTTRHGWTLALRNTDPINEAMLGLPLFLHTAAPAQGLDTISTTASDSSTIPADQRIGNKDEFWAMVPAGGSMEFTVRSAATAQTPVTLGLTGGLTATPASLTTPETVLTLTAPAAAAGMELPVTLKIGGVAAVTTPLRVKVMKPRVINLSIWPLRRPIGPTPSPRCRPSPRSRRI